MPISPADSTVVTQLRRAHSRANANLVLSHLYDHPEDVPALLAALDHPEIKVLQRAAMVAGDLGRSRPAWLSPHQALLFRLARSNRHPAVPRAVLRYFSELPLDAISENLHGEALDLGFAAAADPTAPVTHRVFGITLVHMFCAPYPELKDELRGIIEQALAETSTPPGFRSRGRKVLLALG